MRRKERLQSEAIQQAAPPRKFYAHLFPDDRDQQSACSEIRRIQLIQLRMLRLLDAVCKDYGITYWLDAGTLLGAIRHQGFIPWDDDVDVVMPRPDYDRFLRIAPEVFCEDVFFQNQSLTDPGYNYYWSKLRDRRSTAMDDFEVAHPQKYHTGIGLDIFCFDATNHLRTYYRRKRFMNYSYSNPLKRALFRLLRNGFTLLIPKALWISRLDEGYRRTYSDGQYLVKSFNCIFTGHFPKSVVFPLTRANFEGYTFPVPGDWHTYLTTCYGNYREYPPLEEQQLRKHFKQVDFNVSCVFDKLYLANRLSDYQCGNFHVASAGSLAVSTQEKDLTDAVPLHLIYMFFGNKAEQVDQILFSADSWLERAKTPAVLHFVTDRPDAFEEWISLRTQSLQPFRTEFHLHPISAELFAEWKGPHGFFWRVKMKTLEYVHRLYPQGHLLYLDGDTYVRQSAERLRNCLDHEALLMHLKESVLGQKKNKSKTDRLLWRQVRGRTWAGFTMREDECMWNAGVIGLPQARAETLIQQSLELCDAWLQAKVRPRLIEQFAFSVVFSHAGGLEAADDVIGHYWNSKDDFAELFRKDLI